MVRDNNRPHGGYVTDAPDPPGQRRPNKHKAGGLFSKKKGLISMEYEHFIETVTDGVRKQLGDKYNVEHQEILKNNSVKLPAILIKKMNASVAPAIYLDELYMDYMEGLTIEDVIDHIVRIYNDGEIPEGIAADDLTDYQTIKDRIFFKLVNFDKNAELLMSIPYRRFLDLAVIYCVSVGRADNMCASFTIRNGHMDLWGISEKTLWSQAQNNTHKLFIPETKPMCEVLTGLFDHDFSPETGPGNGNMPELYVLTNRERVNGAACLLYDDLIAGLEKKIGDSLYILPSSIHEVLLIPKTHMDVETLQNMVRDVNDTQVSPQEILSYNVYETSGGRISFASSDKGINRNSEYSPALGDAV